MDIAYNEQGQTVPTYMLDSYDFTENEDYIILKNEKKLNDGVRQGVEGRCRFYHD
jgi:hypothetical protein